MNRFEKREANSIHAIWNLLIMHHSLESVLDTFDIGVADLELVCKKVMEKCNEQKLWEKPKQ